MTRTEPLPVVDAVRRSLEIDEQVHRGRVMVRTVVTLTTNLDLPPARLWPLLTDPAALATWFGAVTGALAEGGRFHGPGGVHGRILQVEVPHRLSLTWARGDGVEDPLQLRLDPEDDGTTVLRLRHSVLIDREEFDRLGPGRGAVAWEIAVLALAAACDGWRDGGLADLPAPTPAWLESEQGAAHVRAWSVRWAAEALAAGVDESTARRGERETASAFGV